MEHIDFYLFIVTIGHTAYSDTRDPDLISTAYMACGYLMRHGSHGQEVLRAYVKLGEKLINATREMKK